MIRSTMRIQVFVGTGGVGKTSVAAAAALKAALEGEKCLVLTIDPALRLRTALNLDSGGLEQRVSLDSLSGKGELWAASMDVRATLDRAVQLYAKPKQAETVLNHSIYRALINSLAGMQELLAVERIDQALKDGFKTIFIDTAPSRHAFEFLDKPEFFSQLVSFPIVQLVGRTYKIWERSPLSRLSRKAMELYGRVEEMLGASLVREILDFYSVFRTIAEGYADRARRTCSLLRNPRICGFTIVTTPFKSKRDGDYLWGELKKRNFVVESMIVNRMWPELRTHLAEDSPPLARDLIVWYSSVSGAHKQIWDHVSKDFSTRIPRLIALPELGKDVDGLEALHAIALNLARRS